MAGSRRSATIIAPPCESSTWRSPADSLLLGKPTWEAAEEAEAQNDPSEESPCRRRAVREELARVSDAARLDQRGAIAGTSKSAGL